MWPAGSSTCWIGSTARAAAALASAALPDAVALLSLMAGLATLLGPVSAAAQASMYPIVLGGIAGLLVHVYLACVALSPATIGVSIAPDETAAGEEAIGAMMFLLKALLRTVPVAFGVGVLWGTVLMGYACCQALWGAEGPLAAPVTASLAGAILIFSAVLPFAAYLLFLLCSLIVELCRATVGFAPPARPTGRKGNCLAGGQARRLNSFPILKS